MCLICVEFQKERMTLIEAERAFGEMIEGMEPTHAAEVREMLDLAAAEGDTESEEADVD